jgi:hypothetical protein
MINCSLGSFERADAADHGGVSVTGGERPFGRYGGVLGFRERGGFSLGWMTGRPSTIDGFGRWGLRGAREFAL